MLWLGIAPLWAVAVLGGFAVAAQYAARPGAPAAAPANWPAASSLSRAHDRPTLVVTLHPRCPCSRATVAELDRLMVDVGPRLRVFVVFVVPGNLEEDWARGDLWSTAQRIPGVTVLVDPHGAEAALFGAATSGQAVLYDASGSLRFRGGLTPSRGHEGRSVGHEVVAEIAMGRSPPADTSDVFGCELFGPVAGAQSW